MDSDRPNSPWSFHVPAVKTWFQYVRNVKDLNDFNCRCEAKLVVRTFIVYNLEGVFFLDTKAAQN